MFTQPTDILISYADMYTFQHLSQYVDADASDAADAVTDAEPDPDRGPIPADADAVNPSSSTRSYTSERTIVPRDGHFSIVGKNLDSPSQSSRHL